MALVDAYDQQVNIWNRTWELEFRARFQTCVHEKLLQRWERLDILTNVLALGIAGGSFYSTWAVLEPFLLRVVWTVFALASCVFTIMQFAMTVSHRIKSLSRLRSEFECLYLDVRDFRNRIFSGGVVSIAALNEELQRYSDRYKLAKKETINDVLGQACIEAYIEKQLSQEIQR